MSPGPILVRCPACGQAIRAVLATGPSTQWFPCPQCHRPVPVLAPRDPPPLYTWEVLPGLYPPLPPPRRPRRGTGFAVRAGLLGVVVLSLLVAGTLAVYGMQANVPATFTVSGTVVSSSSFGPGPPVWGASVVLRGEAGFTATQVTDSAGHFSFSGVPAGGVNLTVSASGYAPAHLITFVSPVYDAGSTGLTIGLSSPSNGPAADLVLTPFPDLETFLATLGGGATLCGLAAALAALGLGVARRPSGAVVGVLGGGAGAGLPAVALALSLSTPFPLLALLSAVAGGCGAFVLVVEGAILARAGSSGA